jgi:2,3-bisphosphoglycerate-independent phosphoglycerate mutase
MERRVIAIIGDGMADRPTRERKFETPLDVAEKPNLDELAKVGSLGLMDPISPGVIPGSDVAHFSLLGYDPRKYYTGRGSLEAVGAGVDLSPGDVAFRCNFATVDENLIVIDRRAGRIKEGTKELAETLTNLKLETVQDVTVDFRSTVEHRGVLILRGGKISRMVSDTDPHRNGLRISESKPLDNTVEAKITAQALNEFTIKSFKLLKDHPVNVKRRREKEKPANIILSRGAGVLPTITPISALYRLRSSCIAAVTMVRGICKIAGMDLINVEGATGSLNTNFAAKAEAAVKASSEYDYVFVHVKAPDIASHDGNYEMKVWAIEKIDEMIGRILDKVDLNSNYIAVTADHATPVSVRDHSGDPVPLLIAGSDVPQSGISKYSEKSASRGNMGRIHALDLTPILMNYLGKAERFGS